MNLKITSSVPISIGGPSIANIVGNVIQHAYSDGAGGLIVPCDLEWWYNTTAMNENKDKVWPVILTGKLASISVVLTAQEASAANLPYTIYVKVAEAIQSQNPGYTVIVEI